MSRVSNVGVATSTRQRYDYRPAPSDGNIQKVEDLVVSVPFRSTLEAIPGLVPIEVNLAVQGIAWGDIGQFQLRQALYDWGLKECHESVGIKSITQAPLNVLKDKELVPDGLMPSGFLFHMSRCGSSLLAKVLAHGEGNLMISEPEPLNQLLFFLSNNLTMQITAPDRITMLRNMILALGRKRQLENSRYYLKFTSWNVLLAESIVNAFPGVPSVFLYRNPEEVMVSIARNATGFSQAKRLPLGESMSGCDRATLNRMPQEQYVAAVLARMMASATDETTMHFLNYSNIDTEHLPRFLEFLTLDPDAVSLQAMGNQFRYDSKNLQGQSSFSQDTASKQAAVTSAIRDVCEQWLAEPYRVMQVSHRNLVR